MNLLILSVGTRDKLIRYFKRSLAGAGRLVAADADVLAPALYEADVPYVAPPISSSEYLD